MKILERIVEWLCHRALGHNWDYRYGRLTSGVRICKRCGREEWRFVDRFNTHSKWKRMLGNSINSNASCDCIEESNDYER